MAEKFSLYELNSAVLLAFESCFDEETGEINEEAYKMFEELTIERDEKIENIGLYIKNLTAEASALKAEKIEFAKRQQRAEKKAEWLTKYLAECLAGEYAEGKKKWDYTKVSLSFRKSESVVIDDVEKIDDEYMVIKKEPSKTEIKKAIKDGAFIGGAHLEENLNLQVK